MDTCDNCPSTTDVRLTEVGLRCCADCRALFGFEAVEETETEVSQTILTCSDEQKENHV